MLAKHDFYNTDNYPNYIMTDSNWSIWASGSGDCAAIPTPKKQKQGCFATHFGDMQYAAISKKFKLYS